jgi:ParB family chromosome partitioning protein
MAAARTNGKSIPESCWSGWLGIDGPAKGGKTKEKSRDLERLEEELSDALATTVSIKVGARNKGEMVIAFAGLDQLDGIIAQLRAK